MRIHIGFGDYYHEFNTSIWRCLIPAEGLRRVGHDVSMSHIAEVGQYDADAYLLERNLFMPEVFTAIENLKAKGKRLVATFDDHYALMPEDCPSKATWTSKNIARFCDALGLMDVVIVPNKVLVEDYRPFCKDIRYIPNYADPELYSPNYKKYRHGTFNVLWGGNSTHLLGLKESGCLEAMGRLCATHPNVRVVAVADNMCALALSRHVPGDRLTVTGWKPLAEWARFVAENADAIICPLYGEYDRRRSWVKVIDAYYYGIPLVASNLEPFRDTGAWLVENDPKAWYDAISDLSYGGFKRDRVMSRITVRMHDVSIHVHVREYEEALGCHFQSTQ